MLTPKITREVQDLLCRIGYLDPIITGSVTTPFRPVATSDGVWGPNTQAAYELWCKTAGRAPVAVNADALAAIHHFAEEQPPLQTIVQPNDSPQQALARRVAAYILHRGLWLARHPAMLNIVYLEGVDENGEPNDDAPDRWNDRRLLLRMSLDGTPEIVHNAAATTEPGRFYTERPMNARGAARLGIDEQWKAWKMGLHQRMQPALQQVRPVRLHRDLNRDGKRSVSDPVEVGVMGINQHSTVPSFTGQLVGRFSAGCLVARDYASHLQFLQLLKQDFRYITESEYVFMAVLLHGTKLSQMGKFNNQKIEV